MLPIRRNRVHNLGMNSIVAYCMADLRIGNTSLGGFIISSIKTHISQDVFAKLAERIFGEADPAFERFVAGIAILLVFWLILFWMYRRKLFVRI
jgi:heparan-alpha-glucosaminide N-acetyltransferase